MAESIQPFLESYLNYHENSLTVFKWPEQRDKDSRLVIAATFCPSYRNSHIYLLSLSVFNDDIYPLCLQRTVKIFAIAVVGSVVFFCCILFHCFYRKKSFSLSKLLYFCIWYIGIHGPRYRHAAIQIIFINLRLKCRE